MKKVEIINGKEQRITAIFPLARGIETVFMQQRIRRHERFLTLEERKSLQIFSETLRQRCEEEIVRVRNDPKIPESIDIHGKSYTWAEGFMVVMKKQRLEAETRAKREPKPLRVAPLVQPKLLYDVPKPLTDEQRERIHLPIVREVHGLLVGEMIDNKFDELAARINHMWEDNGFHKPPGKIKGSGQLDIAIETDGTVINRSREGVSVSYAHQEGIRNFGGGKDKTEEKVTFGIGYFDKREEIIPDAQGLVSDDELKRGIKAYYVQEGHHLIVIPIAYAESQRAFITSLYDISDKIAPRPMRQTPRRERFPQAG